MIGRVAKFPGRIQFCIFLILCSSNSWARTYYVSTSLGRDSNPGTLRAPWKSLLHANQADLAAGDVIRLRRGDSWNEALRPQASGTSSRPITFKSYGKGSRPVISPEPGVSDVGIGNTASHIIYEHLAIRGVLEGARIYTQKHEIRDITIRDCEIRTRAATAGHAASAGVYARAVGTAQIAELRITNNRITPFPDGLNHWGIYLAGGVNHFDIEGNKIAPAGEDAITVWHSSHGTIRGNRGNNNGENTIDVKDSSDISIENNFAAGDREYNIVVHSVDPGPGTSHITIGRNQCLNGGSGGVLSAGIALLFGQNSRVENNVVEGAYGAGILVKDTDGHSGNRVAGNFLRKNGTGQPFPAIEIQGRSNVTLHNNRILRK